MTDRIREMALAPHPLCREFEADVLYHLQKHKATMHGCPVVGVECKLDGGVAIWFEGDRDGAHWRGALRFNTSLLQDRKWMGDVQAVVQNTLQLLDEVGKRSAPLILRAKAS